MQRIKSCCSKGVACQGFYSMLTDLDLVEERSAFLPPGGRGGLEHGLATLKRVAQAVMAAVAAALTLILAVLRLTCVHPVKYNEMSGTICAVYLS